MKHGLAGVNLRLELCYVTPISHAVPSAKVGLRFEKKMSTLILIKTYYGGGKTQS